jgi:RNA recognition motif-containing protein
MNPQPSVTDIAQAGETLYNDKVGFSETTRPGGLLGNDKGSYSGVGMEGKRLYVGNLNYSVTNEELEDLFAEYGKVINVNVIEGKGFGFVEMASSEEADTARKELHESSFKGRALRVDEANPPSAPARRGPEPPPREPEAPLEDWSHLSEAETRARLKEMIEGSSLKETGFGARRFYFVARDNRIPFLDLSEELTGRLEKGLAAIVEVPGEGIEDYTIVPRVVAQRMKSVDPESVRFLNPEASPDANRDRGGRRPFKRNNH